MDPVHVSKSNGTSWQAADSLETLPTEAGTRGWLEDGGSLTRRLRRLGGHGFRLQVLTEGWESATAEDIRMLESDSGRVRVRRVRLAADGVELVFACTRMPPETLARHPWLARLGHKPLGEALADRSDVRRTPFEFARLSQGQILLEDALSGTDIVPESLWGRRSRFLIGDHPILVYEVFLPGLAGFGDA
jgi:chorismate--pyruvate lyase